MFKYLLVGTSYRQWSLYQKFVEENMSRSQLMAVIKNQGQSNKKSFNININPRRAEIHFTQIIPKEKRTELTVFLNEQIDKFLQQSETDVET